MAGAGSRRDEVPSINSNNVFAALGSLKKKKKKEQCSSKSKGSNGKEPEKEVFWAPAPLTVKSWADVDEDDDDDYYATTAPPETVWGASAADANSETVKESEAAAEESESEDEGLDDAEDDAEEEHENEPESPVEADSVKLPPEPSSTTKENERQLSKKELKKKELEELEAVLAELGYTQREPSGQDDSHAIKNAGLEKKEGEGNGEMERKDNASGESKSARKKKKKDKSLKEQKGSQDHPDGVEVENTTSETGDAEKAEDVSAVDVKERLKKVASMKKKKSSKEMDAAARAAASEAAARNAKLAASKKKEKAHYNQQPVR